MTTTQTVQSFSSSMAKNDDIAYFFFAPAVIFSTAFAIFFINREVAPAGIEAYDAQILTFLMVTAAYVSWKLVTRNIHRNEKNRLEFSQKVRSVVSEKLMGRLTLEDVERLRRGDKVRQYNYSVWLEHHKGKAHLVTDKAMGVRFA